MLMAGGVFKILNTISLPYMHDLIKEKVFILISGTRDVHQRVGLGVMAVQWSEQSPLMLNAMNSIPQLAKDVYAWGIINCCT